MLTDGPYSIVEVSSGGRRSDAMHLPQYISGEELESMVQGEVGRCVTDWKRWETSPLWKKQSEIKWQRISEVPSIYQSIKQDSEDLWKHVEWAKASSNEEKAV
jgi:hypothetical protein